MRSLYALSSHELTKFQTHSILGTSVLETDKQFEKELSLKIFL